MSSYQNYDGEYRLFTSCRRLVKGHVLQPLPNSVDDLKPPQLEDCSQSCEVHFPTIGKEM